MSTFTEHYLVFAIFNSLPVSYRTYIHFHNILRLFDVLPNLPYTTSESNAIITYKCSMCELSQKFANDSRLSIPGNCEISGKYLNFIE